MKINYTLLAILLIASVIPYRATADSKEGAAGAKHREVGGDRVNETADLTTKGNVVKLDNIDSKEQLDPTKVKETDPTKVKETEQKKGDGTDLSNERKENEGSSSEAKKESEKGRLPPVREKCDSSSNHCTDDDKTLVACLRVPGNESPSLSLLIQNKGKGSQSITITAPDSVQLETKKIELEENKDTEVKVSLGNGENGHFIVLSAGHGNCTLDFTDEFAGRKMDDNTSSSSNFSISRLTLVSGVVFLGGLVIVGVSVFMCSKSGRKFFGKKVPKYQRFDMELPVSGGSNPVTGGNEGWDNSWGDNWDDEEAAPMTPSLPLTPTHKFKEGWKD